MILDLANPTRFMRFSGRVLPWLSGLGAAFLAVGLYLAFFLANHTFWVLVARIGYDLDSNFYLAATFLTISPLPVLFAPYS